jgi:hypothetical protein
VDSPIVRFTNELMRLTDDLEQPAAADFVNRVYNPGLEAGRAEQPPDDFED